MDSKYFSVIILTFIILLTVLRVSVTMPVEGGIQGNGENGNSLLEYKTDNQFPVNSVKGIDWSKFGSPGKMSSFRPMDMVKIMAGRVTHGVKEVPESYWFNKTITAGTKILRKLEQWKQQYPRTLGIPLGLILRFF